MSTKISRYFTREECTRSETARRMGIRNVPTTQEWERIYLLMSKVMDRIREACRVPISPTSVYRCKRINELVGGSPTSQHPSGEACDFLPIGWSVKQTMKLILKLGIPFDQMIDEYGSWVHISFTEQRANRRQILRYRKVNGKTVVTILTAQEVMNG